MIETATLTINHIDKNEIFRFLGVKPAQADPMMSAAIDDVSSVLLKITQPKFVYKVYNFDDLCDAALNNTAIAGLKLNSADNPLKGATKCALFSLTLGFAVDAEIRAMQYKDMAKAMIMDAAATQLTEQACDAAEALISAAHGGGLIAGQRFSPGYGAVGLNAQKDILSELNAYKTIGLSMTESFMLTPQKSVTAYLGFFAGSTLPKERQKCKSCNMQDTCLYMKEELK